MEGEKTDDLQPVSVEITEHGEEAGGIHPPPSPPPPGVGNESDGAGASKREELQEGEGPIDEAPCVIADGLKLKLNNQTEPLRVFSYALYPTMERCSPVDWQYLVTEDVSIEAENIRCHQLEKGDQVEELVERYTQSYAKALLLFNTSNDYKLEGEFLSRRKNAFSVPVLVVKRIDGEDIVRYLERYEGEDVFARIDAESTVDGAGPGIGGVAPAHHVAAKDTSSSSITIGQKFRALVGMQSKHVTDLKGEIKRLMFDAEKIPVLVCEDSAKFSLIMSAFHNYEKVAKRETHSDLNDVFKRLKTHASTCFKSDFPFYILLIFRLHKKGHKYVCDDMQQFISGCVLNLENKVSVRFLSQVLTSFIQRGDFQVLYNPDGEEDKNSQAFHLLEQACLEMAEISYRIQNSPDVANLSNGFRPLYKHFIYTRMMWIAMAMKFREARGLPATRNSKKLWKEKLVSFRHRMIFKPDVVKELRKGLEVCQHLKLPFERTCNFEHLADMLIADSEKVFRPFSHAADSLKVIDDFLPDPNHFQTLVTELRAAYDLFLRQQGTQKYKTVSNQGTLTGCLTEGIVFIECMYTLFKSRNLSKENMDSEIRQWLELLLQLVDITGSSPEVHLRYFIAGKEAVLKQYRHHSTKYIIQATEKQFPKLSIHQFFSLYKAFRIWSNKFVQDFLSAYRIQSDIRLSDVTWRQFLGEVVSRFKSARIHFYLGDFLQAIGQKYYDTKRAVDFITDLLQVDVEKLLSTEGNDDKESHDVRMKFSTYLHQYINRYALKHMLLEKMTNILACISQKHDEFQLLVLTVLRREVVPELRAGAGKALDVNFQLLLKESIGFLRSDLSWLRSVTPKQWFCWGILATCCSKITLAVDNFDWIHNYSAIINEMKLGLVFHSYCNVKKLAADERIITSQLPADISSHRCTDLLKYFEWVAEIQRVFQQWQRRFNHQDVTYDDILIYACYHVKFNPLAEMMCAGSLLIDLNTVTEIKMSLLSQFELLNGLLLLYIPGRADAKYCILPTILEDYGVCLPLKVQNFIMNKVFYPEQVADILNDQLGSPLPAGTSGLFQPGHDVYLRLHKTVNLRELSQLVRDLQRFQLPLKDYLEMLVFFKLNKSRLFDKYLKFHLKKIGDEQAPLDTLSRMQFSDFGFSVRLSMANFTPPPTSQLDPSEGLPISNLVKALRSTRDLINKIMKGIATYSEIIAEDKLMLEQLDIEEEFGILSDYSRFSKLSHCEGLDGIRSMLELFQYTTHIRNIQSVCEQYHLTQCVVDPQLKELLGIMAAHIKEEDRSNVTPRVASETMKRVKKILCLGDKTSSKCLDIFAAMTDSAAFYQFMKDKQFKGQQGQAIFLQQYELITAQLQHEEYDETVLNHLLAAFKVIMPFMDAEKSFTKLMEEVTSLNAVNGLKQLETVNGNITLIRLWFSRAEGDTLQNVAKELECIISTGHFTFHLVHEVEASNSGRGQSEILLEYTPSSPQLPVPSLQLERWNMEQIGDFVRKLGFMDKEKEGGAQIKQFLHLNQIANKLFELYHKLRELGHPHYLSEGAIAPISCSMKKGDLDTYVFDTTLRVTDWALKVSDLRSTHSWLLYFSVPKLLQLYRVITCDTLAEEEKVLRIVHEVSFIAPNHTRARERLRDGVERALEELVDEDSINTSESPMLVVGKFLDGLLLNHTLPRRCSIKETRSMSLPRHRSLTSSFAQPLYFCPAYSQADFLCLILNIFCGVPESFQVLRCQATTTEEELSLFLKKVCHHHAHYLVLDVNKLPFKLQEQMVQLHLAMQRDQGLTILTPPSATLAPPSSSLSTIHFVETAPSMLREMPWIQLKDSKDPRMSLQDARKRCVSSVVQSQDFACIQLVYGAAGDGKTHYIKKQLSNCEVVETIALNEAFSPLSAILRLRSIPLEKRNVGLFFNFTILPPGDCVTASDKSRYQELMEVICWFFFDLLLLGYVEDATTGLSFRLPGGLAWAIYIEVPSRDRTTTPGESLKLFYQEVPVLHLLGSPHYIHPDIPLAIDQDVQLVCKYLRAYKQGSRGIDREYREGSRLVKFSTDSDLSEDECHVLLHEYMPKHIRSSKITQQLFIRYMRRRCNFLDCLPAFNFNTGSSEYLTNEFGVRVATNTRHLGSTLMFTMLNEVSDFCDPNIKENWSLEAHQQLIYDFKDGGASLGLISLHPDRLKETEKTKFRRIGVNIPSMIDLYSRDLLDSYLSRALNVELENNRLTIIDDSAYVLTLDYTIKMLNIHERYKCGVPVIIEGETGVGKTALVEMLSKLWNQSLLLEWKRQRSRILDFFQRRLGDMPREGVTTNYEECLQVVEGMSTGVMTEESVFFLCNNSDGTRGKFHSQIRSYLCPMRNDPVVPLLRLKEGSPYVLDELFEQAEKEDTPEVVSRLLYAVLVSEIQPTFHKINVHAAMTPAQIKDLFSPVFSQADLLRKAHQNKLERLRTEQIQVESVRRKESSSSKYSMVFVAPSPSDVEEKSIVGHSLSPSSSSSSIPTPSNPFVTVFLDEVNTSSCLGLFKEIIIDRSFDGKPIPDNVFIVAACNPHRGNSLASHKTWVRGTYYVRSLHPTLKFLMWDYGSLDQHQERDYINAKMKMMNKTMDNPEVASLTDLIVTSQKMMRDFAFKQLQVNLKTRTPHTRLEAHISSRSCVSQRDIQRVFTFYEWFKAMYSKYQPHGERTDYPRRAMLVALGVVYYMRLNSEYRQTYSAYLDEVNRLPNEVSFSQAFNDELDHYIREVELPKGIARTLALKENLFATIVCTVTHTPLIIVGAPGSSKTLSFNQAISNLKGLESKKNLFRNTDIFRSLDPHYYQCSRRTTSNEIQTVFSRAINRQKSHQRFNLPIYCVVFMDEAGLPEESHESLKVLHYHLDKQVVSFVAITNHVLDAAKTNRAISLYRPEASDEDLEALAKGCLCSNLDNPPPELKRDLDMVVKFCQPYSECMTNSSRFSGFFGLRDFIQFVNFLRRKRDSGQIMSSHLVLQALERNFNGSEEFETICKKFLQVIGTRLDDVREKRRRVVEVLQESMVDKPQQAGTQDLTENEVRYKLIIDSSEDDSLVRLLFSVGVLKRDNTRMFVCSNFPGDGEVQKINTIAAIRHSAIEGHTVVMSQTDDIHESFYDLFNQRFRRIDDPDHGARYYTNIAIGAHLKPSRVHPNFQCVVVVKKSELKDTPAPFLNRFEKYLISHGSLLETALLRLPPCVAIVIQAAKEKVNDFICRVYGYKSLYGLQPETLDSLVLDVLPPFSHTFNKLGEDSMVDTSQEVSLYLMQEILTALRNNAGFNIPKYRMYELRLDTSHVLDLIRCDPKYEGLLQNLTHQDAMEAVVEAFNLLYEARGPKSDPQEEGGQLDLTPEGSMVISILQQLLVRLFVKRVMQLMTTEAVILNRNKIPYTYLANYLHCQSHFSLKDTITNSINTLQATKDEATRSPNKLVCFSRSSPLIHSLPSQYPASIIYQHEDFEGINKIISNLVFEDADQLIVHKISALPSQSAVQEMLGDFVSGPYQVCLLLANMLETSSKIINHIRVMIEEAEMKSQSRTKLFVLLLHFPPAQFFQHCYPALFLRGWDHTYLDAIAHSTVEGVVNIEDWFFKCCFPMATDALADEEDTLLKSLDHLLPQAISVLSARVYFGNKNDGSFNSSMNATQRGEALRRLLFECGVGAVLCEKFRAYWKPKVMAEYLERAASFSKQRESTLNITDSIQTQFRDLFFDFCVYMLTRANENFNLDIVFSRDCPRPFHKLFIQIFKIFPTPKLSQLNLLSNNLPGLHPPAPSPHFPFFTLVRGLMDKQVEVSSEAANIQVDVLAEQKGVESSLSMDREKPLSDPGNKLQALIAAVTDSLDPIVNVVPPKQVLSLAIPAMAMHSDLWHCYFTDYLIHKLKLVGKGHAPCEGDIVQKIFHTYFEQLHSYEALHKIVELHCYLNVYHLAMAPMAVILRPLSEMQKLYQGPHPMSESPDSSAEVLLGVVRQTRYPLGSPFHLSSFVINTFFNSLVGSSFLVSDDSSQDTQYRRLEVWFNSYRDIMTLPTLKQFIYFSLAPESPAGGCGLMEAVMSVMQATYLTLQTTPALDRDGLAKGQKTFQVLFTRYFNESRKLKSDTVRPSLSGVIEVAVECLSSASFSPSLHRSNASVRRLMEGILAHFFSPYRPSYYQEDVVWLLKLANEQEQWGVRPFIQGMEEINKEGEGGSVLERTTGVISADLGEDLLEKLAIPLELPPGSLEMSMFKYYLARILGNCAGGGESPLLLHHPGTRALIGDVLMLDEHLGPPGPYIPMFYQTCPPIQPGEFSKNERMQQPLCHLYFLVVIEHLLGEHPALNSHSKLTGLVRAGAALHKQLETAEGGAAVLLWVEFQAVIQVLIKQLAIHLNPVDPHKIGDIQLVLDDLNNILDNPVTGGGVAMGHGMVLSLHLIKLLKSSRRFTELITGRFDSIKNINCLQPIHHRMKTPSELKPHLFPFLQPGASGELSVLYKQVAMTMLNIHSGSQEMDHLIQIAQTCIPSGDESSSDKRFSFRMIIWLVTYYEFYDKKIVSRLLCNIMGGQEMSHYLREEGYIRIIQCFLLPDLMIQRKEGPNALTEQDVLELDKEGRPRVIERAGTQVDPLYQLFMPDNPDQIDQSDIDLRHALANLMAVVIGGPSRSNHLWFHLFAADRLENTHMTGFMYDAKVHRDGLLYDCGVELSPEGQFGRQDYKKHACRGVYTLHSLYLLLWANFGAFCLALLTQPDSDERIHGNVISEWLSVRHYCVSQLKTVWLHIGNNLGLSEEQRSFLIMRAMERFHKLVTQTRAPPSVELNEIHDDTLRGIFESREALDSYEKVWHTRIYQPTWEELTEEFQKFAERQQNQIFHEIRQLEISYPHFPSEGEFSHCVLSAGDLEQHSEGGRLWLLARFAMEWPRLQRGGFLLPDLIELYQWLHSNIAHLLTYDQAATMTIGHVITQAEKNSSKESGQHLRALYERVKMNYNNYVELIGGAIGAGACAAVRRGNKIFTIADDIPLLHFLTDVEEEEQGNDWLYVVAADIITNHNHTIENLYSMIQGRHAPLKRLLLEEPSKIYPTEVTMDTAIVGAFTESHGINSLLQLIRSRYQPISADRTVLASSSLLSLSWGSLHHPRRQVPAFQLEELEEDVVVNFITGKPLIESPSLVRNVFKFKKDPKQETGISEYIVFAAHDLQDMAERLPNTYKSQIPDDLLKTLEYEFHSAGYHLMVEVLTAMRTITGHLLKALTEKREDYGDLESLTIPAFMLNLYEHLRKHSDVLYEIGIHSAAPSHLACLAKLPLVSAYSCLRLFFNWVDEGYYDFCDVPFVLKVQMSYPDRNQVEQKLQLSWPSTLAELLGEVQQLVDVLKHSEKDIICKVNKASNKPIRDYLLEYHMLQEEDDLIARYIPGTIMLQHYVAFRLSLRRLLLKVHREELVREGGGVGGDGGDVDIWLEFISDLWEQYLPHFREVLYGQGLFIFNPNTGCYGFQEEEEEEEDDNADSMSELMAALLEEPTEEEGGRERGSGSFRIQEPHPEEEESLEGVPSAGHTHTLDLDQLSSDEGQDDDDDDVVIATPSTPAPAPKPALFEGLEEHLLNDPDLKKRVLSLVQSIGQGDCLEELARGYTFEAVSKFLLNNNLSQYSEMFLTEEISGDVLYSANSELLLELGVAKALDRMKIMVLFRRVLVDGVAKYNTDHVIKFLKKFNLDKYIDTFRASAIDGDMILEVEEKLMKSVLREVGVVSLVDIGKIRAKYKTFVSDSPPVI